MSLEHKRHTLRAVRGLATIMAEDGHEMVASPEKLNEAELDGSFTRTLSRVIHRLAFITTLGPSPSQVWELRSLVKEVARRLEWVYVDPKEPVMVHYYFDRPMVDFEVEMTLSGPAAEAEHAWIDKMAGWVVHSIRAAEPSLAERTTT